MSLVKMEAGLKCMKWITVCLGAYLVVSVFCSLQDDIFVQPTASFGNTHASVQPRSRVTAASSAKFERENLWRNITKKLRKDNIMRRLPDVIGIGVKKCGTGALIHFLGQHPLIQIPVRPETFFFTSHFTKGLKYYVRLMPKVHDSQLIMEKTPMYFNVPGVADKIRRSIPKVKLILSLCNPVDRAFSDFVHVHSSVRQDADERPNLIKAFHRATVSFLEKFSGENRTIEEEATMAQRACQTGTSCFFSKGIYHSKLAEWQDSFTDSDLLVLNGDDWITDPGRLIEDVQRFLGLPKALAAEDFVKSPSNGFFCLNRWWRKIYDKEPQKSGETILRVNRTQLFCLGTGKGKTRNGVQSMHFETYELLQRFYRLHNLRLYEMLGQNFSW